MKIIPVRNKKIVRDIFSKSYQGICHNSANNFEGEEISTLEIFKILKENKGNKCQLIDNEDASFVVKISPSLWYTFQVGNTVIYDNSFLKGINNDRVSYKIDVEKIKLVIMNEKGKELNYLEMSLSQRADVQQLAEELVLNIDKATDLEMAFDDELEKKLLRIA